MSDFDDAVKREYDREIAKIKARCQVILEEEIQRQVYDKYEPLQYKRTNTLRDSVRTEIRGETLYIYINSGDLTYKVGNKEKTLEWLPFWINYGHNSNKDTRFMFYQYPSRGFITEAKRRIEQEFGVEVTMITTKF